HLVTFNVCERCYINKLYLLTYLLHQAQLPAQETPSSVMSPAADQQKNNDGFSFSTARLKLMVESQKPPIHRDGSSAGCDKVMVKTGSSAVKDGWESSRRC
ncbi:hypothetical protein AMECASPLE_012383, partial [Ameca splendens]